MSEVEIFRFGGQEGYFVFLQDYDALAAQRDKNQQNYHNARQELHGERRQLEGALRQRDEGLAREAELRDALDHIAKTCGQSRTDSRRLRWIEYRAKTALEGKPYDNSLIDLPKNGERNSAMLMARIDTLQQRLAEAEKLLLRVSHSRNYPIGYATQGLVDEYFNPGTGCADGEKQP